MREERMQQHSRKTLKSDQLIRLPFRKRPLLITVKVQQKLHDRDISLQEVAWILHRPDNQYEQNNYHATAFQRGGLYCTIAQDTTVRPTSRGNEEVDMLLTVGLRTYNRYQIWTDEDCRARIRDDISQP